MTVLDTVFNQRTDRIKYEQFGLLVEKLKDNEGRYNLPQIVDQNVQRIRGNVRGSMPQRWLDDWQQLVMGPREVLYSVMRGIDEYSIEMRQNSPFGGILTEQERLSVLAK